MSRETSSLCTPTSKEMKTSDFESGSSGGEIVIETLAVGL